ncbi:Arm DNA-binding domain-containing protein [Pseudosulfitobacter sp. DSM 107133]|uniref:Arm DNA-binding domain-containing protein n=1 Tax=Pseudosulfitobacter sp. DSM 107133 TaxID=2883100 RepID=UPI001F079898|nr:Arm DNA-binding domain-containing protein [Pseudosulfitobacter sp. DSM 107133]
MGGLFPLFPWIYRLRSFALSGAECGIFEMALSGKLTKKLVENLGAGRHGDGNGLYLVVDPSGARRWIVRVVVKGQKNKKGAPLRTDFGLGGADTGVDAE